MLYRDAEVVSELARADGTIVRARVGERTLAAIQNLRIDTSPDDVERAADLV
jgi:hypothetical protein